MSIPSLSRSTPAPPPQLAKTLTRHVKSVAQSMILQFERATVKSKMSFLLHFPAMKQTTSVNRTCAQPADQPNTTSTIARLANKHYPSHLPSSTYLVDTDMKPPCW
ncbi:hypothetical protein ACN47E_001318 [Coniothyrium glycines]